MVVDIVAPLAPAPTVIDMPPLYIDLDGTLLKVDTLYECFLAALKNNPLVIFRAAAWLTRGKAFFKYRLAEVSPLAVQTLPVNAPFLDYLIAEKARGRRLVLATAADSALAKPIAARFGLFEDVLASDGCRNLSSCAKRDAILAHSNGVFDYAGNSKEDIAIWKAARRVVIVNASAGVSRKTRTFAEVHAEFPRARSTLRHYRKAFRLHQWLKNALIFAPVLAAHQILNFNLLANCLLAFLAFGFCASSVYILNDLLDLEADRSHPRKSERVFASGSLSAARGLVAIPFLLTLSGTIAVFLPIKFAAVLLVYYCTTFSYSLFLKRVSTLDIFVLASLYTLRVIAGAACTGIHLSFWLLAFSMFLFLGLAAVKRVSELVDAHNDGDRVITGRNYSPPDIEALSEIGVASSFTAVLVLALYIRSPEVEPLYRHPEVIYLVCPLLLYWLSRCWVGARRGKIDDDPLVFAVRDRVSRWIFGLAGLLILASI
jgi:4-hydroxybenzoate polyprenyltransferase